MESINWCVQGVFVLLHLSMTVYLLKDGCGGQCSGWTSGSHPHFLLCSRESLVLFPAVYTSLAGPHLLES